MQKGILVLFPFPFTDLTGSKVRPALVLHASELDVTVAFLTTQMVWAEPYDVTLAPNAVNGLKKNSLVRLSKIATIEKGLVLGELGKLDKSDIVRIDNGLLDMFQLQNN